MLTRKRITPGERQVQLLWLQSPGRELATEEGHRVTVVYPGRNDNRGPDFRDAVIASEEGVLKGDVEIHVRSSDWYVHRHDRDAQYNRVVLHAVLWHDCSLPTTLKNGTEVPVLVLSKSMRQQLQLWPEQPLPCSGYREPVDGQSLRELLRMAGLLRFRQKAARFVRELEASTAEQTLWRATMRAVGYARNSAPFERLADMLPLCSLHQGDGPAGVQAIMLGAAGLLPSQRPSWKAEAGEEAQELERRWRLADRNFTPMSETDWCLSGVYPNNSPVRRIVAVSHLLHRYRHAMLLPAMLQLVKRAPVGTGRSLERALMVEGDGHWRSRFDLDVGCRTKPSALLGPGKAGEIAVNALLPFSYSWAVSAGDRSLAGKAFELYLHHHKLCDNGITVHMARQLGIRHGTALTACEQQGLLYLYADYCREGRCRECPCGTGHPPPDSSSQDGAPATSTSFLSQQQTRVENRDGVSAGGLSADPAIDN